MWMFVVSTEHCSKIPPTQSINYTKHSDVGILMWSKNPRNQSQRLRIKNSRQVLRSNAIIRSFCECFTNRSIPYAKYFMNHWNIISSNFKNKVIPYIYTNTLE